MEIFKNHKSLFSIIKGTLISFLFTVISLLIFSILLVYTNLSEETIKPVIIIITAISILIGSSLATKNLKKNGLLNGAIIGLSYITILYLISSTISTNFTLNLMSLTMIAISTTGGIIGRNNRSKHLNST